MNFFEFRAEKRALGACFFENCQGSHSLAEAYNEQTMSMTSEGPNSEAIREDAKQVGAAVLKNDFVDPHTTFALLNEFAISLDSFIEYDEEEISQLVGR